MKTVAISSAIKADPLLLSRVQRATELLDSAVGQSGPQTAASWALQQDGQGRPLVQLVIGAADGIGKVETVFSPDDLGDERQSRQHLLDVWGDLLQVRTRKLLELSSQGGTTLDGQEAWDEIVNALGEFEVQKGIEPTVLKLPIKYAVALMKLGPSYWGDFFQKIRTLSTKAFEDEPLLGMRVHLVPGADSKLELEAADRVG